MSLVVKLEHGPRTQAVREARLDKGELVIGRSPDADWQIEDPDMFVSRAHCRITGDQNGYFVTDISSSGLYIDESPNPLGSGNTAALRSGMRLKLGDYVLWVELVAGGEAGRLPSNTGKPAAANRASFDNDGFFSMRVADEPAKPRPSGLPTPFDQPRPTGYQAFEPPAPGKRDSAAFDDPFSLDPVSAGPQPRGEPFDVQGQSRPPAERTSIDLGQSFDDFSFGLNHTGPASKQTKAGADAAAERTTNTDPWDLPAADVPEPQPVPRPSGSPKPRVGAHVEQTSDPDLRAAFMRGLGFSGSDFPGRDTAAEMERFGREYRLMMEGLMQLLRKRAEEKSNARVAQTVVGSSEVNPLKFLPSVDDALGMILLERSPGFLSREAAIADSLRDLAGHHVRAWRGVQAALRRMIDRFDPAAIEEELKSNSALGTLLSGGRSAKLWELYQKRHREIAQSAETRFLGEIGADFRDAYEEE